jgi:hypothetical protein
MASSYRSLNPDKLIKTLGILQNRITERFPGSGLAAICAESVAVAQGASARAQAFARPNRALRALVAVMVLAAVSLLVVLGWRGLQELKPGAQQDSLFAILQGVDSGFNIVILIGAALLFLSRMERNMKRDRALADLHELRAIAHVIDMHQLTKDPAMAGFVGQETSSSPKRNLTPFELSRYLDYCSEMLALLGKIAALYAQSSRDDVVISNVNEIEQLVTNLSEKIWQKIAIIHASTQMSHAPALMPGLKPLAEVPAD